MEFFSQSQLSIAAFIVGLVGMEGVAYITHKYVMHGWLWCLHKSHHQVRTGRFELNDWFAVIFSTPAITCIAIGYFSSPTTYWLGWGITAYGAVYFLIHDVFVHKRVPHNYTPQKGYFRRILHAHRLHHAVRTKHNCVSFGFVYAEKANILRARMKELESLSANANAG